nr:MAG TPA_asm: L(+)-Mandelate Dehydrogenase BARREL, Hydroxy acid oxidizing [Caudoviricetes sp.]DAP56541.1 MAG TPA: L(+)-Mandelate Dehydrogenase BARREL, Hydroxy acid oxidizing [Caudoviricetes sp.]
MVMDRLLVLLEPADRVKGKHTHAHHPQHR